MAANLNTKSKDMKYKIKKGNHYACPTIDRLWPFSKSKRSGGIWFDKACSMANVSIPGWNKLTGISGPQIHKNSGRLVWQPAGYGKVKIATYVYDNGKRTIKEIARIDCEEWYSYSVECAYDSWIFKVDSAMQIVSGKTPLFKFKCFPYFGGECVAPTDLVIHVSND